jgi:hypothetical protein
MSKTSQTNINEMMAGDGASLCLPPAFVFVNTKKRKKIWHNLMPEKIDGRKKSAKNLIKRIISRRKSKVSEEYDQIKEVVKVLKKMKTQENSMNVINEVDLTGGQSKTAQAQKQIAQQKKLNAQKELQKKRGEAKNKLVDKAKEMDTLLKARLADYKSKAAEKTQKVQKQQNSYEPEGNFIDEDRDVAVGTFPRASAGGVDVFTTALKVVEEGSAYGRDPETSFANLVFNDGSVGRIGVFDAKRILATYESLDVGNKDRFRVMLNMSASSYAKALDFAIRNV